jgi:uncharacterized membrane protein (UPF0127 family)
MSRTFFGPLLRGSSAKLVIRNLRSGKTLADDLIAAFDSQSRRTGLLRHERFPEGSAMLIAPSNAVHTFFMRFPIDIAFVTREGRVVKTYVALPPWRIAAAFRAYAVVELPTGTLARSDTNAGDTLAIVPLEQV